MPSVEEVKSAIASKGAEIKAIKDAKPPTMKEDIAPLVSELLALKLSYKELTGEDFDPPKKEKASKEKKAPEKKSDGPSKTELNKAKKKAHKEALRAAERAEKSQQEVSVTNKSESTTDEDDPSLYGDLPLINSSIITDKIYKDVDELSEDMSGFKVWIRARVHSTRAVGKGCFLVLRQRIESIQAVLFQGPGVSKNMVKYATSLPHESIVDILAEITLPESPVLSTTIQNLELRAIEVHAVSRAEAVPFQVEDAGRSDSVAKAEGMSVVKQDTALNYRWIDTRTQASQAIFRINHGVCALFREFFTKKGFTEIHTPKLIYGASEGGSSVFTFNYFDTPACLAQSPQLYKQIVSANGGFEKVFEIGPVFRAENSNTHRHLCEFTGCDFEMAIKEHYYEVLQTLGELFCFIFDGLAERYSREIEIVGVQYPVAPLKYLRNPLRITFAEGIAMLKEAGCTTCSEDGDISTTEEKWLGKLVREKYGTDFYMMDKYPLSVRPFYTMPCPKDPKLSNSFDLFIRGEEILSGAQRIHDPDLLYRRAKEFGCDMEGIRSYLDSFKHGSLPHGGGGIGLERVVMLYLGIPNIRKVSMFPRDPSRLTP